MPHLDFYKGRLNIESPLSRFSTRFSKYAQNISSSGKIIDNFIFFPFFFSLSPTQLLQNGFRWQEGIPRWNAPWRGAFNTLERLPAVLRKRHCCSTPFISVDRIVISHFAHTISIILKYVSTNITSIFFFPSVLAHFRSLKKVNKADTWYQCMVCFAPLSKWPPPAAENRSAYYRGRR